MSAQVLPIVSPDAPNQQWPEPSQLGKSLLPVPKFVPELLPKVFRPWVGDIAHRLQCPPEFAAVGAMIGLAAVVGRRSVIRPKRNDNWTVIPNLWGGLCARPSALKTPALDQALQPLRMLEAGAHEHFDGEAAAHRREKEIAEIKKAATKERIKAALKKNIDATSLYDELADEPLAPILRRFITHDPTVEKLGELMRENPRGILLFRDELVGFLRSLEREGRESDRAFFLEAWNGSNPFTSDRIGRGTIRIEATCVSMLGTIQPGVLTEYIADALRGGAGDDGLVQRFQLLVFPDEISKWSYIDEVPNEEARSRALKAMQFLDQSDPVLLGGEVEDDGFSRIFRFDDEAQEVFIEYLADLERKLHSGDDHPAMNAHLGKYRSLMPSLALLNHLADSAANGTKGPVTAESAWSAVAMCDLLEAHARRIYGAALARGDNAARMLAEKIRLRKLPEVFGARDVYNKGWSGLSTPDDARRALIVLEDSDWVRSFVMTDTGGRAKTTYTVNPRVYASVTEEDVENEE